MSAVLDYYGARNEDELFEMTLNALVERDQTEIRCIRHGAHEERNQEELYGEIHMFRMMQRALSTSVATSAIKGTSQTRQSTKANSGTIQVLNRANGTVMVALLELFPLFIDIANGGLDMEHIHACVRRYVQRTFVGMSGVFAIEYIQSHIARIAQAIYKLFVDNPTVMAALKKDKLESILATTANGIAKLNLLVAPVAMLVSRLCHCLEMLWHWLGGRPAEVANAKRKLMDSLSADTWSRIL